MANYKQDKEGNHKKTMKIGIIRDMGQGYLLWTTEDPQTSNKSATASPSLGPFLSLPGEIRQSIYEEHLSGCGPTHIPRLLFSATPIKHFRKRESLELRKQQSFQPLHPKRLKYKPKTN